jgi:hypothetical protein
MKISKITWNPLNGEASEPMHKSERCVDHHAWEDEYGTMHPCHNCGTTDGIRRWVEYKRRPEYDAPEVSDEDTFEI